MVLALVLFISLPCSNLAEVVCNFFCSKYSKNRLKSTIYNSCSSLSDWWSVAGFGALWCPFGCSLPFSVVQISLQSVSKKID